MIERIPWRIRTFLNDATPFLVVLVLIVCIAGVLGPAFQQPKEISAQEEAERAIQAIATAFHRFHDDIGRWPAPCQGMAGLPAVSCSYLSGYRCLVDVSNAPKGWQGPYLQTTPPSTNRHYEQASSLDPWGNSFEVFWYPANSALGGPRGTIAVLSAGPDGMVDTPLAVLAIGESAGDDLVKIISR
ncbi:MAG: type II secretion system protein GspG [Planctomycetes bacterium]|nr:type II secretion system protein GspG [Planctomycetota bacterium]